MTPDEAFIAGIKAGDETALSKLKELASGEHREAACEYLVHAGVLERGWSNGEPCLRFPLGEDHPAAKIWLATKPPRPMSRRI